MMSFPKYSHCLTREHSCSRDMNITTTSDVVSSLVMSGILKWKTNAVLDPSHPLLRSALQAHFVSNVD